MALAIPAVVTARADTPITRLMSISLGRAHTRGAATWRDDLNSSTGSAGAASSQIQRLCGQDMLGRPPPLRLRHAALSTWLKATADALQVADGAGHSVAVLLRV
jgi:hypothetical protein